MSDATQIIETVRVLTLLGLMMPLPLCGSHMCMYRPAGFGPDILALEPPLKGKQLVVGEY